jgi:hypothetical protein
MPIPCGNTSADMMGSSVTDVDFVGSTVGRAGVGVMVDNDLTWPRARGLLAPKCCVQPARWMLYQESDFSVIVTRLWASADVTGFYTFATTTCREG